jgi:hypothetical protein
MDVSSQVMHRLGSEWLGATVVRLKEKTAHLGKDYHKIYSVVVIDFELEMDITGAYAGFMEKNKLYEWITNEIVSERMEG